MSFIGDIFGGDASDAATSASNTAASYQQEALDYLLAQDELPSQLKQEALGSLGGVYGLEGGTGSQQDLIDTAIQSPLYQSIMGGQEAGEEAILRNASATGGLRSGNVQENLYDYNTQLQNQALLESYNQQLSGLSGLAGQSTLANEIANTTSGIGTTLASGTTAAAQAQSSGTSSAINTALGLGGLALDAYNAFSDRRLKKNIKKIGKKLGWNIYSWDWNEVAEKMGMSGKCRGVMADEVYEIMPDAVMLNQGFMMVNYSATGLLPWRKV